MTTVCDVMDDLRAWCGQRVGRGRGRRRRRRLRWWITACDGEILAREACRGRVTVARAVLTVSILRCAWRSSYRMARRLSPATDSDDRRQGDLDSDGGAHSAQFHQRMCGIAVDRAFREGGQAYGR